MIYQRPRAVAAGAGGTPSRQLPGPRGLPFLGQLVPFLRSPFFPAVVTKWADRYGKIMQFEILGNTYVVVTGVLLRGGAGGSGLAAGRARRR